MSYLFPAEPARHALQALLADTQASIVVTAAAMGVDPTTLHRLFTRDLIRYDAADRIAVALGHHPSELWSEWFATSDGDERTSQHRLTHPERTVPRREA